MEDPFHYIFRMLYVMICLYVHNLLNLQKLILCIKILLNALMYICDLILENRRYLHNFQNAFYCSLFTTGTEEWTSQVSAS